jgi:trk system potassium uptake protein TrkH
MSYPLALIRLLAIPVLILANVQFLFGILSLAIFRDGVANLFFEPGLGLAIIGLIILMLTREHHLHELSYRQALLFTTMTWVICGLAASEPISLIEGISHTDAVFEAMSALTMTGATVLMNLDMQPKSFLLYRQFLQWIGGMGVVVFVVAIVPMLNIGGMKIFRAESPGPANDEKLAPRIQHTAQHLWIIYLAITVLCALAYYLGGMSAFDALAHSFTTVSTGGFSTHDASLGYFHSHRIEMISVIFMVLGAVSFTLHFRFAHNPRLSLYIRDEETRDFLLLIVGLTLVLFAILAVTHVYAGYGEDGYQTLFHLVSFVTSTGYGAGDFTHWPIATSLLLIFAGYVGGCAGSTAGGNKMIRNIISIKVVARQMKQLIHPKGLFVIKYKHRTVSEDVSSATMSYMVAAAILTVVFCLLLQATGLDFWTAFTAVAACLNVLGPAFGELGANFQPVSDIGTWILTFTMLLGRLEFYCVLVLLTPAYWHY